MLIFGPTGSVSRTTVESEALKTNMLGDPAARVVDVYVPAGHDGQGLPLLVDLVGPSFAKEEVPAVIEALIDAYRQLRQPAADGKLETFIATLRRVGHEPFKAAANAARFVEREIA